jgi:hypothetical protein
MQTKIVDRIKDMGYDPNATIEDIDQFVDECIAFLTREQEDSPDFCFKSDIFELENARQQALMIKFSLTVQPK